MSQRPFSAGTGSGILSATGLARTGGGALRSCLLVALAAVLGSCATKSDVRDLRDDLQEVAARQDSVLAEIERQQRVVRDSLAAQGEQAETFRGELTRQIRDLEEEVLLAQEISGQTQRRLARLQDELEALQAAPPPSPGGAAGAGTGGTGEDRQEDDPWGGAEAGEDGELAELFDGALEAYERGQYTAARFGFEELVEEDADHELAPRALYYLAQIRFQEAEDEEDYEDVVEAFLEIPQFHPDADAVPEAYLRVGEIHLEELDDEDEAREYFERVVESFPDTDAADIAREHLDGLG